MEITPCLGIGDIIIIKLRELSNNLKITKINIDINLIKKYCSNFDVKVKSITNLIKFLFPYSEICIIEHFGEYDVINNYQITQLYLYDYINTNKISQYNNYIIFHTKVRIDGYSDYFKENILPIFDNFIKNFNTIKNIIIMGERKIEENYETTIHKVFSIYDTLIQLKKNNNVIDLSKEVLCSGNNNFDDFLQDIEIINKADYNITFGIGGPFCIVNTFSKNALNFIIDYKRYSNNDFINNILPEYLFSDINKYIDKINLIK